MTSHQRARYVATLALSLTPALRIPDRDLASSLGWGGTSRAELRELARCIRERTERSDRIVAPPYEAFLADRLKVVSFKDNWGMVLWMEEARAAGDLAELRTRAAERSFAELRLDSGRFWLRSLGPELAAGRIPAVLPNYELPIPVERLREWGYREVCRNAAGRVLAAAGGEP